MGAGQHRSFRWQPVQRDAGRTFGWRPRRGATQYLSAGARGLFQRAVIQGDPWLAQSVAMMDHTANRTIENALAKKKLATDLTDAQRVRQEMSDAELVTFLREMPADELLTAHLSLSGQKNPVWSFVIQDGHVIPDSLYSAVESGRFAHVPIMIGANQMESGFANMNSGPQYPGMPDYRQLVQVVEGTKKLEEVLPTEKDRGYWLKGRHYASLFYRAMAHEHARRLAARQCDVYVFSFNWGGGKVCPEIHTFTFGEHIASICPFCSAVQTRPKCGTHSVPCSEASQKPTVQDDWH